MQRVLGFCLLSLAAAASSHAQATTNTRHSKTTAESSTASARKKTASAHARTTGAVAKSTAVSKSAAKSGTKGRASNAKGRRARAKPAPSYQLHPDPERYQQIQQALADRGYFKGQVNGEWGDDSVEALKKFQSDQKLDSDGKISALSLIGLGLGPKHDGTSGHDAPVPPPPPPTNNATTPETTAPETQPAAPASPN